jgi:hypothetical protein
MEWEDNIKTHLQERILRNENRLMRYKINGNGSGSDAVASFCASTAASMSSNMGEEEEEELVIVAESCLPPKFL